MFSSVVQFIGVFDERSLHVQDTNVFGFSHDVHLELVAGLWV